MIKLLKRMRRREALMALVCAVLVVAQVYFDLKLPDYMTRLTTLIKTPGSVTSDILSVGGQMLLCTLASAVLAVGCGYLAAKTASGFSFSVRADLFHHVMDAGSEEMQSFSVPSLITRTTNDITQIQMIVAMGLQMLMKAPIMAVWAVIKILGKSWTLSAVTGGFVVAIVVMVLLIMSSCLPRFRQVQKKTDQINRVARENLTGINVVHAFGAEDYQNRKFDGPSRDMMNLQLKNQRLFALLQPMLGLGMNGLALAIYWVGAALVESIALTDPAARLTMFTNVLVFSTYATYVVMSFMMLVMIFMLVPQAQVSAERINEVLDTKPHVVPGTKTEGEERGTVEFRDVSFRYPGAAADELEHISFKVRKGQTLAVIGATGSGKTTLTTRLAEQFPEEVTVIRHDDYYKHYEELTLEERKLLNYDHPNAFDTELLIRHLMELKQGRPVECPVYDYAIYNRSGRTRTIQPRRVVIVEGILIFENRSLCDLMDIRVFVDTDADIRIIRRIQRDVVERGRSLESVIGQYINTVKPMHEQFVEPSKRNASIIVPEGGCNRVAMQMLLSQVRSHLRGED